MEFNITFQAVTYEESRYEFFLQKKHEAERKLGWYTKRLSKACGHRAMQLYEKCCELGCEVSYYDDAIKALDIYEEVKE